MLFRVASIVCGEGRQAGRPALLVVFGVLCLMQPFDCGFRLLRCSDSPDSASFDLTFHADFFANQVTSYFSGSNADPSTDLKVVITISNGFPPTNRLCALSGKEILQILSRLERSCRHIGDTWHSSRKCDNVAFPGRMPCI